MNPSWSILGGDPAPGHPGGIQRLAGRIGGTAQRAAEGQRELNGIATMSGDIPWKGDAAEAFEGAFEKLIPDLGHMARAYERVSQALDHYASRLTDLQERAREALREAHEAQQAESRAASACNDAERSLSRARSDQASASRHERTCYQAYCNEAEAGSPSASTSYQQYLDASRHRSTFDHQVMSVQGSLNGHAKEVKAAQKRLKAAKNKAEDIHRDWKAAGKRCDGNVRDALDDSIKNHRFRHYAGKFKDGVVYTAKIPFWVVEGAAESVYSMGKMLSGLTLEFIWNPTNAAQNWKNLGTAAKWAYNNPGEAFTTIMNVEGFLENPAKWAGGFAPDVIAMAFTGGGAAALRVAKSASYAQDMAAVNRIARATDAATPPRGPGQVGKPNFAGDAPYRGPAIAHTGPIPKDLVLVQVSGKHGAGSWWVTIGQAGEFKSMADLRRQLALMPSFGSKTDFTVARVPAGTTMEYRTGIVGPQSIRGINDLPVIHRPGGATQVELPRLNPDFIAGTTPITRPSQAGWAPVAGGVIYVGADGVVRVDAGAAAARR